MKYLRETGAEMDIDQFVEIFGARVTDPSIRIPRSVEGWFEEPKTDAERKIKGLIALSRIGNEKARARGPRRLSPTSIAAQDQMRLPLSA
jgi:hypothetical protein